MVKPRPRKIYLSCAFCGIRNMEIESYDSITTHFNSDAHIKNVGDLGQSYISDTNVVEAAYIVVKYYIC